jgi:putative transcriptional regulator
VGAVGDDWRKFDELTEEQVRAAAESDPDARPLTARQLAQMKRISPVKRLRWKLRMSQQEFASTFGIALETLRNWELGRAAPDRTAQSYLRVIASEPDTVRRALAVPAS